MLVDGVRIGCKVAVATLVMFVSGLLNGDCNFVIMCGLFGGKKQHKGSKC